MSLTLLPTTVAGAMTAIPTVTFLIKIPIIPHTENLTIAHPATMTPQILTNIITVMLTKICQKTKPEILTIMIDTMTAISSNVAGLTKSQPSPHMTSDPV